MTGTDHGIDLDVLALTTRRALQTTDPTAATAKEASAATPMYRIRGMINPVLVKRPAHSPYSQPGYGVPQSGSARFSDPLRDDEQTRT